MTFPLSHKTVFVVDHTLAQPSGVKVDMDNFCKPRSNLPGSSNITLEDIPKSIWTCAVEAISEYCRIVWDIFPGSRFISFTCVDGNGVTPMSTWNDDQNLAHMMQLFMNLGPARKGTPDLMLGCLEALKLLTEATPQQQHHISTLETPVTNKGRIIVVTRMHSNQEANAYYQNFVELVGNVNRNVGEGSLAIANVNLVILNFIGNEGVTLVKPGSLKGGGGGISGDLVEMMLSGSSLAARFCSLVVKHYNLSSTTVTGIPMKEEQNASSSANYDVELFHPAEAHSGIIGDSSVCTTRVDTDYPTVTLKWCTPRTNASHELHQCTSALRITSVDVNSRPSSCLTNFLLNGRWVMLEIPRKTPSQHTKVLSHMLAAHAGDIYIHTLLTKRSVLEDPPSISEGQGGKVTDYRIPDFSSLIRNNILAPSIPGGLQKSQIQLERQTKVWPITLSQTAFFSLGSSVEPLTRNMMRHKMTEEQAIECKTVILSLTNMEHQGENLVSPHIRNKGLKREDQYKAMWNELEQFLLEHNSSIQHQTVLECFIHCTNKEMPVKPKDPPTVTIDDSSDERESTKRVIEDKRESKKRKCFSGSKSDGQSLLSLWQNKIKAQESNGRPQFAGRLKAENNVTKLYTNLQQKEKDKEEQRRKN